jgi:hypothetical protein
MAVVIACVFVSVNGTADTGTRIELAGGLLLVGVPAIPFGTDCEWATASSDLRRDIGRPHRDC